MNKKIRGNIKLIEIVEKINKAENIVLTTHINPDGDALGSILAFYFMIKEFDKEKNVEIVIDDKLPNYMRHFEETKIIKRYNNTKTYIENKDFTLEKFELEKEIDLFISLDCANEERYGETVELKKVSKDSINIDHHISNTEHANFNYVEDVSSTSELVYQFLELFNIKLNKQIGNFIYLGIVNDTGNFRHDNVTPNTFNVCSKLLEIGVNNHKITNIIFEMNKRKINLFGDVYKNCIVDEKYGFIYYYLTQDDIKLFGIEKDETDGIAEIMLKIENMEISLFAREEIDGMVKGSLRCNDKYNVNEIASIFGGGGHIKASGFKTELSIEEIIEKIYTKL